MTDRFWCATLWVEHLTEGWEDRLRDASGDKNLLYSIAGSEICPDTGRAHYQAYFQFKEPVRVSKFQKIFGKKHKYLVCNGSDIDNVKYCEKDGNLAWEWGTKVAHGRGRRNDIVKYVELCKDADDEELMNTMPGTWAKYPKLRDRVLNAVIKPRHEYPQVIVYWGEAGSGKSTKASEHIIGTSASGGIYFKPFCHDRWWPDYHGNPAVVIDDFKGEESQPLEWVLKITDRYPLKVETKGDFVEFNSSVIIFTSQTHPKEWYPNASLEENRALARRLGHIEFVPRSAGNTKPLTWADGEPVAPFEPKKKWPVR